MHMMDESGLLAEITMAHNQTLQIRSTGLRHFPRRGVLEGWCDRLRFATSEIPARLRARPRLSPQDWGLGGRSLACYRIALTLLAFLALSTTAFAQSPTPPMAPAAIAAQIAKLHPKTVVFVFDVTMSTLHAGVFKNERAATATILRNGCAPGDHVVLLKFGTGDSTVFDKTLATHEDSAALVDQVPGAPEPGRGTNIRLPHAEALKIVEAGLPQPGVIVLLTDSFNDQPAQDDPHQPQYTAYYSPKGLTVYPDTPENRDYERLLGTLKANGKLHEYGVGVGIAPSGRPIERLPVGPGESDSPDAAGPAVTLEQPAGTEEKRLGDRPFVVIGCFAVMLIGLIWVVLALGKPTSIRLALGDRGTPRDFRLKSGAKVCLGGGLANCRPGDDFFPLPGLASPVAFVAASGGGATLNPAGDGSVPDAKVFHNGVVLDHSAPLRIGDEIKITVPAPDAPVPREFRLRFTDPKAPLF